MITISISLSSKITRDFSEADCQKIRQIISEMMLLDERKMENLIWQLTFNSESTAKSLGLEGIDGNQALKVRNELAKKYRKLYSDWKYGRCNTPETDEEKQLWKALKGDGYAYDTVMRHIKVRSTYEKNYVGHIIYLLNSEERENQFGGIRCLGFRAEEAEFLRSSANAMGKVLGAISN